MKIIKFGESYNLYNKNISLFYNIQSIIINNKKSIKNYILADKKKILIFRMLCFP